ncbi:MAG: tRNA uridine-5-carboxymethylaminomethyl(34) synthesis GTPase MnmE [Panacagrimonas sp.]
MKAGDRSVVETIAAVATAPGRGAVGILRLSGPQALQIAEHIAGSLAPPRQSALREFRDHSGALIDKGLLICFPAPHSYTGEDVVELQGHGGPVVMDLLLQAACARGARPARAGEYSERAFLNDRLDLAQAEAVADLIDASSRAAVIAANRSLEGEFSRRCAHLADAMMELRVFVEGALDFSDEDVDWLSDTQLQTRLQQTQQDLEDLLTAAAQGRRLRDGLVLVIAGQPNVGKSTLLNRLAGIDAAIVSDIPGTTRDALRENLVINGLPLTVIDTAGLRDTTDSIEAEGIRRAWRALEKAELALYVVDDRAGFSAQDRELIARLPAHVQVLLIFNKCDLSGTLPRRFEHAGYSAICLSAAEDQGIHLLRDAICEVAGFGPVSDGVFSARTRHIEALRQAQSLLQAARTHLNHARAAELAAEDLRRAHAALGEITGRVTTEDLLGAVFSKFCIGK